MSVKHVVHRIIEPGLDGDGFSPPEAQQVRNDLTAMPTVIAGNYTKRLANYASLDAAIADLPDGGAQGGEIQVDGELDLSGQFAIPANIHLIGRGSAATALRAPNGLNVPLVLLDGASGAVLADIAVIVPDGVTVGTSSRAVGVFGDADDVVLDRVLAKGFHAGILIDGSMGATPGTIRNLRLDGVRADESTGSFGIQLSHVDGVVLTQATANRNWLDGLKLQASARNVTDVGGIYNENGQVAPNGGGAIGDGIDGFAGSNGLVLLGTTANGNHGNGVYLKTDSLTRDDPGHYGYVRNNQVANIRCQGNTIGSGLVIVRFPLADATVPYIAHVSVQGGLFEGNKLYGVQLNGLDVTTIGATCLKNGRHGIMVEGNALYTRIVEPKVIANSQDSPGTYDGIYISAGSNHTEVDGYTILGVDAENVRTVADLDALTPTHRRSIYAHTGAQDVRIGVGFERYTTNIIGIVSNQTTGIGKIDYRDTRNPMAPGAYGSPGSTFTNLNAGNTYDVSWIRRSGAPNQHNVGWQRISDPPLVSSLPAASKELKGTMLTLDKAGSGADTLHICVQIGASSYAWKELVLA